MSGAALGPARPVDALFHEHHALAIRVARRLARRSRGADGDDLVSDAVVGLLDAIRRYDASRGVPFSAYARRRILGAIVDGLRGQPGASRQAAAHRRLLDHSRAHLAAVSGRRPDRAEIARYLGLTSDGLSRREQAAQEIRFVSLDGPTGSDEEAPMAERLAGDGPGPDDLIARADEHGSLRRAFDGLSPVERRVVDLCFLEERTVRDAGTVLGISGARVHQIRQRALARLRRALEEAGCDTSSAHCPETREARA